MTRKVYHVITGLIVLIFVSTFNSHAQEHPEKVQELIKPYIEAFQDYNKKEIRRNYFKIMSDKDVVEYMSENMPKAYQLLNAWTLVERAEDLQLRYGNKDIRTDYVPSETVQTDTTTGQTFPSNQQVVRDQLNQNAPRNQDRITRATINNNRISNYRVTQKNPNSRRTSNRDRIKASVRRR